MENQLIHLYLFVCQMYDTDSATCFQRLSNNSQPRCTDQELVTIWLFAHVQGCFEKKQMHQFIANYWAAWFPALPAYQTFVARLNQLEPTFQTLGRNLSEALAAAQAPELDRLVDSVPVMLARHGHSYTARVARDLADVGYCAAKKTRFHGVRLHVVAQRRTGRLPLPEQIWLCAASHHDSKAFIGQTPAVADTELFGDLAYPTPAIREHLDGQGTRLVTPVKTPRGGELTTAEKYYNRLARKFRQPIESLFNWLEQKTGIQTASKVRSSDGLLIHCWGKLAVAAYLLLFNY